MRIIHNTLAVLIVMRSFYGIMTFVHFYSPLIQIILFVVWFTLSCMQSPTYISKFIVSSLPLLVFLILGFLVDVFFQGTISGYMQIFGWLGMIFAIYKYYENGYIHFKKILLGLLVFDSLVIMINSLILLQNNPMLIRNRAGSPELVSEYSGVLYSTFSMVYALGIVAVFIFLSTRRLKSRLRYVLMLLFAFISYFIFSAQFMIALLGLVILIFFFYFWSTSKRTNVYIFFSFLLLLPLSFGGISYFLYFLASNPDIPQGNQAKFYELAQTLSLGINSDMNLGGRIPVYLSSLNVFINNILFGLYSVEPNSSIAFKAGIGGHSSFFDALAYLGLLRALLLALFFIQQVRFIIMKSIHRNYRATLAGYFTFLFYVFFNPVFSSEVWIVLFIIIPFFNSIFYPRNNYKHEVSRILR